MNKINKKKIKQMINKKISKKIKNKKLINKNKMNNNKLINLKKIVKLRSKLILRISNFNIKRQIRIKLKIQETMNNN